MINFNGNKIIVKRKLIIIIVLGDKVRQVIQSNKKGVEIDLMKVRIKELIKGRKIGRKE